MGGVLLTIAIAAFMLVGFGPAPRSSSQAAAPLATTGMGSRPDAPLTAPSPAITEQSVILSDQQLAFVKVEAVPERDFPSEKQAVGSIDFNQDMAVQVFTPYPGRILNLFAKLGDDVRQGDTLFTIDSPDLLQAELRSHHDRGDFGAANAYPGSGKRALSIAGNFAAGAEQATSDQQAAEGGLRAARNAVRIFGKTDAEIDHIIADRRSIPRWSSQVRSLAGLRRGLQRPDCSFSRVTLRLLMWSLTSIVCG